MTSSTNRRLFIVQPYVPRYRTRFYEALTHRLADIGLSTHIVVGRLQSARTDGSDQFPATLLPDRVEELTRGKLRYRPLGKLDAQPQDLLLLEQAIKNLDAYKALAMRPFGGPKVAFWGHGRSYSSTQSAVFARLKQWETRQGQWFFAYTHGGAQAVIDGGFPAERVSIVNNTFDTESLERHLGDTNPQQVAEWCREIEVDPHHTALFIGGLDRLKSLDFLVASATAARSLNRKFALIVGGSGPDQTHLIELQRRGLPIRVVGRLDGREKALALSSARVLAVPSQLGLVVIDSFVSGVPLITREGRLHGPEAEYLRPGEDSVWLARDTDPVRYAKEMVDIMSNGQALRVMSIKCRERAPEFTLGAMVEAFAQGVQRWAGLP